MLCKNCNAGIGLLGDDPDILERAVTYLQQKGEVLPDDVEAGIVE